MQNLLKILLRYSNFLVFIALEVAAFLLISYNNAFPRSSMLSTANAVVAWQEEQVSEVRGYFSLRSQNEQLATENAALRNQICSMESGEVDTIIITRSLNLLLLSLALIPIEIMRPATGDAFE